MGLKTGTFAVVSAAFIGGGIRLLMYPQFVVGMLLMILSVALKLSKNVMGLLILAVLLIAVTIIGVLFSKPVLKSLKNVSPKVSKWIRKISESTKQLVGDNVKTMPSWIFTVIGFTIPALGQFFGSLGTIRMLSNISLETKSIPGIKIPMLTVPGIRQSTVLSLLYMATQAMVSQ